MLGKLGIPLTKEEKVNLKDAVESGLISKDETCITKIEEAIDEVKISK